METNDLYKIEVYIMKKQISYSEFIRYLIATDGCGFASYFYTPCSPETAEGFYKNVLSALDLEEGEVELHCKGKRRALTDEHTIDGYFGRPKLIIQRENFLRSLIVKEKEYLEKQFRKISMKNPIKLKLVD